MKSHLVGVPALPKLGFVLQYWCEFNYKVGSAQGFDPEMKLHIGTPHEDTAVDCQHFMPGSGVLGTVCRVEPIIFQHLHIT